jgi:hypothetical protein
VIRQIASNLFGRVAHRGGDEEDPRALAPGQPDGMAEEDARLLVRPPAAAEAHDLLID